MSPRQRPLGVVLFDARELISQYYDLVGLSRPNGREIERVMEEIDSYRISQGCRSYSDVEPKPLTEGESEAVRLRGVLSRVKATLSEVAVYEGMPIGSDESVLLYLSELVRDHEELERRIDLAMFILADEKTPLHEIPAAVANILKGAERTPDDLSEIEGGGQG